MVIMTLLSSLAIADNKNCISKQDFISLDGNITLMHQLIKNNDLKNLSTYMNFPITDNHNHAITKRVFLEEDTYQPVINVRKILKEAFPESMKSEGIKNYQYLDECNKHVVENSEAEDNHGLRFIFKKIGKVLKLKLISFVK